MNTSPPDLDSAVNEPTRTLLQGPVDVRSASLAVLAMLASVYVLHWAGAVFIPLLLALLFSYALSPAVDRMERWHVPRAVGSGALLLGATIVIALVAGVLGMGAIAGIGVGSSRGSAAGMMAGVGAGMLSVLLMLVMGFLVGMAMWFAPALVVFGNLPPVDAAKASFAACMKNVVAFLVFGVIYIVAAIIASIPFGLGWLVLVPLLALCAHFSYKEVFE